MISVIVPVYNVEKYFDQCMESLLAQTYTDFEIVLIDDGSTDSSGKKCDEWEARDSRICVFHQENVGLSETRSRGLQYAKGEYIAWVDSDDYVDKRFLEVLLRELSTSDADMVMCGFQTDVDGVIKPYEKNIFADAVFDWQEFMERVYTYGLYSVVWNKLVKKSVYDGIRFPKGRLFEDSSIMRPLAQKCRTIKVINESLYFYRRHQECITMKKREYNDNLRYIEQFCEWIQDDIKVYAKEKNERLQAYASKHLCNAIVTYGKQLNRDDAKRFKRIYRKNVSAVLKSKHIALKSKVKYAIANVSWSLIWIVQKVF